MSYDLGIDIGTSYSAAAVRRDSGAVDVVGLGSIADSMPSVVYLSEDGTILIGDAANRRSVTDPQGAAREFKRRLGDSTPIILRTSPFSAEQLYARTLEHVVQRVIEREQGPPRNTIVTHPANWGPYKLELFSQALRISNLDATGLTEPAAAAWAYGAVDRVPVGAKLAIYDLGGGTFDAAVLEKTSDGFEPLGESTGIEHLGGVDFDAAILDWVRRAVGDDWPSDPEDPQLATSMLHLRRSCSEAKELLSSERDVIIPVLLPGVDLTLTLTRPEFENMIRPKIDDSIASLESALSNAGIAGSDATIVLVGGSSRIPMIREELEHRYGPVVANDVDPLYAIATGAAVAASAKSGPTPPAPAVPIEAETATPVAPVVTPTAPVPTTPPTPEPAVAQSTPAAPVVSEESASPQPLPTPDVAPSEDETVDLRAPRSAPVAPEAPAAPATPSAQPTAPTSFEPTPASSSSSGGGMPGWLIPAVIGALVIIGGVAFFLLNGGGDDTDQTEAASADEVNQADDSDDDDDNPDDEEPVVVGGAAASADGMVEVVAGDYTLGTDRPESNDSETLTQTGVPVNGFFIDATEVTNADWKTFVDTAGAAPPSSWGRAGFDEALADHPVLGVNFEWASVYCQALSKRIPTEAEWEVAARGGEAFIYPWGDDVTLGGIPDTETTYEVGSIATNVSPFGAFDMVGNAWEWVSDSYDDRVDPNFRVLRGGQNGYLREAVTRLPVDPQRSNAFTVASFRCVADDVDSGVEPLQFSTDFTAPETDNEAIEVALAPGVLIQDAFTDSTSGWIEETNDDSRFGYHPNEFFHLETKAPGTEVFANSPVALEAGRPFEVVSSAFVEPSLTEDDGSFLYGVFVSGGVDGTNISFFVDPRRSLFSIQQRQADGTYSTLQEVSRAIPDDVELTVSVDGDRYEFRLNGAVVNTQTITGVTGTSSGLAVISDAESSQVHIHFEEFEVAYLDEA